MILSVIEKVFFYSQIHIHDRVTAACLIKISNVRKVIQHLLWKPPTSSHLPYVLGVASGENIAFIFDLDEKLRGKVN